MIGGGGGGGGGDGNSCFSDRPSRLFPLILIMAVMEASQR